ncbi:hypothetical protein [Methylovulum psychrotolerans]|jgi:hypothetical protein|uniref:Uncharacterized protein n=1 Tax=Methylovulum psychrotolerans TaxID=1704499 RepID=A0A2S5CPG5_9GAMM|nr:hypothetical protein [Methylovulum psychrotolerans]MBT9098695.1 hypothetical protein [Methylovulum psychrotolerans]POZ52709.1 hypothetical protein AADEFJLK_01316 [Methylovulum psychrotolerans]
MTDANDDLWPADLVVEPAQKAPLIILSEQAEKLGKKTANLVEAEVTAYPDNSGDLRIRFTLKAPALNGYEYALFSIIQPVDLYPVRFSDSDEDFWNDNNLKNEQEFKRYLEKTFKADRTVRIINNLIAQSKKL